MEWNNKIQSTLVALYTPLKESQLKEQFKSHFKLALYLSMSLKTTILFLIFVYFKFNY